MEIMKTEQSPLSVINVSFSEYVARHLEREKEHMHSGVPDYAFAMDYELRARLNVIPHFESLCRKIVGTIITREIHMFNQKAIAVGPNQYPEIYRMGVDCAHRLGIGVPNIFVYDNPYMNAFTYATDEVSPMIVLFTGILDRMNPGELRCVIGHECGHIHNQHAVYRSVISAILNSAVGNLGKVLSAANLALMQFWSRACEITADRAALICAENPRDAVNVLAKLLSGGTINQAYQHEVDLDALWEQLETTMDNPTSLSEILQDHPSSIRRIFATREFGECETYFSWRPEERGTDSIERSKSETDERCKKLINILPRK